MIIRRTHLVPQNIGVIIAGYPSPVALDVARECNERGFRVCKFGLATEDLEQNQKILSLKGIGNIRMARLTASNVTSLLEEEIIECRNEGLFVVIADTTENALNVNLYNTVNVPFVIQCKEAELLLKAIRHTEASKSFAVISGHMNQRIAAFDATFAEWSRRFAGLFEEHEMEYKTSRPLETPKSLMTALSDLTNRDLGRHQIQDMTGEEQKKLGFEQTQLTREFTFKSGEGSEFKFRQSVDDLDGYAEGVADAVSFLAQKAHRTARPQVYNILDVAEQNKYLMHRESV